MSEREDARYTRMFNTFIVIFSIMGIVVAGLITQTFYNTYELGKVSSETARNTTDIKIIKNNVPDKKQFGRIMESFNFELRIISAQITNNNPEVKQVISEIKQWQKTTLTENDNLENEVRGGNEINEEK